MFAVLLKSGRFVEVMHAAVDAGPNKALCPQLVQQGQVLALALAHNRCQQHQLAAFGHGQYLVDHLADGLGCQWQIVVRAARLADAGKQQTQIIVYLGDGAHGGAWVVRGRFLFNGNSRGEPFDVIDIGLFHHRKELAGIRRERLDIAALTFGVQGIEGQGRLARTRQPGYHDQLVTRQIKVNVLQVVGARPTNQDGIHSTFTPRPAKPNSIRAQGCARQKPDR